MAAFCSVHGADFPLRPEPAVRPEGLRWGQVHRHLRETDRERGCSHLRRHEPFRRHSHTYIPSAATPSLLRPGPRVSRTLEEGQDGRGPGDRPGLATGTPWHPHTGGPPHGVALTLHLQSDWRSLSPPPGGHQLFLAQGSCPPPQPGPPSWYSSASKVPRLQERVIVIPLPPLALGQPGCLSSQEGPVSHAVGH